MANPWILLVFMAIFVATVVLSRYVLHRRASVDRIVQGDLCISAGLITLLSLLLPWLKTDGNIISGIDVGLHLLRPLRLAAMFLPVFALLIATGGFLLLTGYILGKRVALFSSVLALSVCTTMIYLFSCDHSWQGNSAYLVDWGIWICISGNIVGVIGGLLSRGSQTGPTRETRRSQNTTDQRNIRTRIFRRSRRPHQRTPPPPHPPETFTDICPACNRKRLRPGQDICDECGQKLTTV